MLTALLQIARDPKTLSGHLFDRPKAIEVFVNQRDRLVSSPLVLGN